MRILAVVMASVALTLAVTAFLLGVANLAGGSARVWALAWEKRGYVNDWAEWNTGFERLRLARQISPLNADYSADLGRLADWRSWQQSPRSDVFKSNRALAETFYLEAISKRPSWGFVWAQYAENQLLQGNSGSDFQLALLKAIELAPWEPGAQRKVAWMGMATWDLLPARLRNDVRNNIERAVQLDVHRYEIVRLAVHYDWLPQLIPMMRSENQITTLNFVLQQIDSR